MGRKEGHEMNLGKILLDKEKNWRGRKIKEAMYINAAVPTCSTYQAKLMILRKGMSLT